MQTFDEDGFDREHFERKRSDETRFFSRSHDRPIACERRRAGDEGVAGQADAERQRGNCVAGGERFVYRGDPAFGTSGDAPHLEKREPFARILDERRRRIERVENGFPGECVARGLVNDDRSFARARAGLEERHPAPRAECEGSSVQIKRMSAFETIDHDRRPLAQRRFVQSRDLDFISRDQRADDGHALRTMRAKKLPECNCGIERVARRTQ